jgi:glycosyltransferase involved in cell wall biosynthesis
VVVRARSARDGRVTREVARETFATRTRVRCCAVETHAPLRGLRVLHFGHFDPQYSRNRIVAKALRRAGAEIRSVTDPQSFARRTPTLLRRGLREPVDLVLVGFPGHADVPTAKAIAALRRAPLVFDPFVSLQETADDRGRVTSSLGTRRLALEDRLSCRLADRVLVDTDTHGRHFVDALGADPRALRRVWVGADDDVMRPRPLAAHDGFRVFVYASFIPLHGLEHVVRAAALLEARREMVTVDIVGGGATESSVRALASQLGVTSVRFLGRRPYAELPDLMADADVCLGIFGTSPKARRVIPNKVFDALACARPVITGDTPAMRELLRPGEEVWLCEPGDATALADAITTLRDDAARREAIAAQGHERFRATASIDALAVRLAEIVAELV